jgi:alanine racemase
VSILLQPRVKIHLQNLRQNFNTIQSQIGEAKILAVLKADAYGHGIIRIAQELEKENVHGYCVALVKEIHDLINASIKKPILHLGRLPKSGLDIFTNPQVRCTINSILDIQVLENLCKSTNTRCIVHINIDTGMGRMGVAFDEFKQAIDLLTKSKYIKLEGIYSHFATAETNQKMLNNQLTKFLEIKSYVQPFQIKYFHIANSAGMLINKSTHFNLVRTGIALYGVNPIEATNSLKPVMEFVASVVLKKKIKQGESIGYGQTYIAKQDMEIAIIQSGYADGIPIEFSNTGFVYYKEHSLKILGKVSMDLTCIEVGESNIQEYDKVSLWGCKNQGADIESISKRYNTIPYIYLTGVSKRVKREYVNE